MHSRRARATGLSTQGHRPEHPEDGRRSHHILCWGQGRRAGLVSPREPMEWAGWCRSPWHPAEHPLGPPWPGPCRAPECAVLGVPWRGLSRTPPRQLQNAGRCPPLHHCLCWEAELAWKAGVPDWGAPPDRRARPWAEETRMSAVCPGSPQQPWVQTDGPKLPRRPPCGRHPGHGWSRAGLPPVSPAQAATSPETDQVRHI